ncbi:type II secretion system protein [Peribacillus sp. SCS-155]|uniref:type II secretion system protein n=1 Tax=Peribacillus sedimenti TaxID=3115297 RepID=UPI00390665A8
MNLVKKHLKNERGLTLIELLAVVVILGIIAAIAIPSIGGLIDNSKKDAHVANARQMVSAGKLAITGDQSLAKGTHYLPLGYLEAQNYVEHIKSPDKGSNYSNGGTTVGTAAPSGSYVVIENGSVTTVKLVNTTRGVQAAGGAAVDINNLDRDDVLNN